MKIWRQMYNRSISVYTFFQISGLKMPSHITMVTEFRLNPIHTHIYVQPHDDKRIHSHGQSKKLLQFFPFQKSVILVCVHHHGYWVVGIYCVLPFPAQILTAEELVD